MIVLVLVAVLVAVPVVVIVSRLTATSESAAPDPPSGPALSTPALSTTGRSTQAQSTTGLSTPAQPTPAAGGSAQATVTGKSPAPLPQTGPGVTEPGILLVASPAADGSFDVLEQIRLASPISVLTLSPASVDLAGGQFGSASATATDVQVVAGDQSVVVPGATVGASIDLPVEAVDRVELRYRLTGVTVRSNPSTDGRALAAIGPLTGNVDGDLPVLIVVSGGTVLGLNCPLLPFAQQSCGSRAQTGSGFEHELPWRLALASVQFNVPVA